MKTVVSEQIIMWDCDQTLIMWEKPIRKGQKSVHITCPYSGKQETLRVHQPHIKILKDRHARGATNVVWSAGGYQWAAAVVKALGLTPYVSLVMSKPVMFVDDKPAASILGEHLYLDVDANYGK
jgi:FMN phosphatase YigB (HAD superfamily)